MDRAAGIALIVLGSGIGLVTAVALRPRIVSAYAIALYAGAGVVLGTGALLVQSRQPNLTNWAVTVTLLAFLTPLHMHLVFGPPRSGAEA
ncbi:MAG: hypothetical protein WD556_09565 [Actinomycetota bacterium]